MEREPTRPPHGVGEIGRAYADHAQRSFLLPHVVGEVGRGRRLHGEAYAPFLLLQTGSIDWARAVVCALHPLSRPGARYHQSLFSVVLVSRVAGSLNNPSSETGVMQGVNRSRGHCYGKDLLHRMAPQFGGFVQRIFSAGRSINC